MMQRKEQIVVLATMGSKRKGSSKETGKTFEQDKTQRKIFNFSLTHLISSQKHKHKQQDEEHKLKWARNNQQNPDKNFQFFDDPLISRQKYEHKLQDEESTNLFLMQNSNSCSRPSLGTKSTNTKKQDSERDL